MTRDVLILVTAVIVIIPLVAAAWLPPGVGHAILQTSSNAPVMVLALPEDVMAAALVPHMGVVLASLYALLGTAGKR